MNVQAAYSAAATAFFTSSISTVGSKRSMTLPSRSIRNLVKFQPMYVLSPYFLLLAAANLFRAAFLSPLPNPSNGFSPARNANSGSAVSPLTSILANCGNSVPN